MTIMTIIFEFKLDTSFAYDFNSGTHFPIHMRFYSDSLVHTQSLNGSF